jgi:hypothetical protein
MAQFKHAAFQRSRDGSMPEVTLTDSGCGCGQNVCRIAVGDIWELDLPRSGQCERSVHALWANADHARKVGVDALVEVAE